MSKIEKAIELLTLAKVKLVKTGEVLANHSQWQIGGPADIFVNVSRTADVVAAMRIADQLSLPLLILGGGSNLLFDDAGYRGIVVKVDSAYRHIQIDGNRIIAGAGVWVPCLAKTAAKAGLAGLEHICGIPGSFGGLLFMNGGSQRKGIADNVVSVSGVERDGTFRKLTREQCKFAYRESIFQDMDFVILEAELECERSDYKNIREEMLSILRSRRKKFPRKLPNCGSVFVSNPNMYATYGPPGKIIEECDLKYQTIGDAQVSPCHANFIVNLGKARSSDVISLIDMIRRKVYKRTQCWLDCEVRYVRQDGVTRPIHHFLESV